MQKEYYRRSQWRRKDFFSRGRTHATLPAEAVKNVCSLRPKRVEKSLKHCFWGRKYVYFPQLISWQNKNIEKKNFTAVGCEILGFWRRKCGKNSLKAYLSCQDFSLVLPSRSSRSVRFPIRFATTTGIGDKSRETLSKKPFFHLTAAIMILFTERTPLYA